MHFHDFHVSYVCVCVSSQERIAIHKIPLTCLGVSRLCVPLENTQLDQLGFVMYTCSTPLLWCIDV